MTTITVINERGKSEMKKVFMLAVMLSLSALLSNVNCAQGALCTDLNNVIVYPNPFRTKLGHTNITFDNLTGTARIKIYKKTGELIYERVVTTADGRAIWDLTNNSGSSVA